MILKAVREFAYALGREMHNAPVEIAFRPEDWSQVLEEVSSWRKDGKYIGQEEELDYLGIKLRCAERYELN